MGYNFLRHVKTYAEINNNINTELELKNEELDINPINHNYTQPIRGKRKRLPTLWSDIVRQVDKSWKSFRKHQYKN